MVFNVVKENWRKTGVYCITNCINSKIYIGSTSVNFRHRYLQYQSGFKRNLDNQPILYRAFRKYGIDNFKFEVVSICSKEDCIITEQFYINKGTDYNSCLMAGSLLGFKHSVTSKTKTMVGGLHHCAKPIYQFNLTGELIKKHTSIIDALKAIYKTKNGSSHITQCCTGRVYSAFGYRWSFNDILINRPNRFGKCSVNVDNGIITKNCDSQKEAALFISSFGYKCNQGRINRSITKTKEKVYGFEITKLN